MCVQKGSIYLRDMLAGTEIGNHVKRIRHVERDSQVNCQSAVFAVEVVRRVVHTKALKVSLRGTSSKFEKMLVAKFAHPHADIRKSSCCDVAVEYRHA